MGQITIAIPRWNIEEATGYKPFTTFWQDFSIADKFGKRAISGTFNRAFSEWKKNYKYLTELVLVLNHKCWAHYKEGGSDEENAVSMLYSNLYYKTHDYACRHLKGDELSYYIRITD